MPLRHSACEVIEISHQNVAAVLTVAIQALVIGGLIACLLVGSQEGPSLATSSSDGVRHVDYRPQGALPGTDPVVGSQPGVRLLMSIRTSPSGGNTISFSA